MAALSEFRAGTLPGSLVDLRDLRPNDLEPLLLDECREWHATLDWDFEPAANLVRRFVGMRNLLGYALTGPGPDSLAGYAYYVADEGKGLIGGMHVLKEYRTNAAEQTLLTATLDALWRTSGLHRVEAQLMLLEDPLERSLPYASRATVHARDFLEVSLAHIATLPPREPGVTIAPWTEQRRGEAARLIPSAYTGHIDGEINDQYHSPGGARRFLTNIVEYPGCGAFFAPASFVALERHGSSLAGMCLASVVAAGVGHITQVCVAPSYRAKGLGYELLRRSLLTLAGHGCHKATLTVTSANREALVLYERMGFVPRRRFAAYVWKMR